MSFNDGFDPLDFGSDLLSGIKTPKRKQKGTFDEILSLAGIGRDPFLGFGAPQSTDDFAIPVKRKRRSKEAVALGIREDAESPIFGLQFFGNAVGVTESALDSKQFRSKLARDKKAITDTFGPEIGRFKTDKSGKIRVDEFGKPIRSKDPEDFVILGRTLNPRVKEFIDTQRTKRRTKKGLKKTLRQSEFGTASPSSLTQAEPLEFLSSEGKPVRLPKQKPEDTEVLTSQGILASTPKEKEIIQQATSPIGSRDQLDDFGVFQLPKLEENELAELDTQNENKRKLRDVVGTVVFGNQPVLREITESKPVASLRRKPVVFKTEEGREFVLERQKRDREETAGGRLLSSLSGITERIESQPILPFSETGRQTDLSPIGEQAEIRIEKQKRRKPERDPDVGSFFEKQDEETRKPTTFADAEENGALDADEGMKDFTDPDESKSQNLQIQSSAGEDEFSDLIFRGGKPVSKAEEQQLIEERKKGRESFREFITRPKVKKSEVFEETDLDESELDKDISDSEFTSLGKAGALPTEAQSFFEEQKRDEPTPTFTSGFNTDFTKEVETSEPEQDKRGGIGDFGDIIEQAKGAKDVGVGTTGLGTGSPIIQTESAISPELQTQRDEPKFDTSFNDNKKKDGIRPDIDRRSSLSGGLPILSTIDKIQKGGVVNNPVRKITEDESIRNKFLERVASGQISEEGIQQELDLLTDPDIPKATRTRKRRTLKDALKVIRNFKAEREGKPTPLVDREVDPNLQVSDTTKQVFESKLESEKPFFKKDITKEELKKQVFRENAIVPVESLKGSTDRDLLTEKIDKSETATGDEVTDVRDDKDEDKRLRTKIVSKGKKLFNLAKKAREKGTTVEDEEEEEEKLRQKAEELEEKERRRFEMFRKDREKAREREELRERFRRENEDNL